MSTPTGRDIEQEGPVVLLEKHEEGKIWVITLNRPHRMNSLGDGMAGMLSDIWDDYKADDTARVAIVTGAGDRAFCAGADLIDTSKAREGGEGAEAQGMGRIGFFNMSESMEMWKPTIAAINGYAIAGGFMIAMQCDIRIVAEEAKVGVAEARWNMPGAAWMASLSRQMTLGNALELCLWADTQYSGQRAYEAGWAQAVVPRDQLMETAMQYAQRMLNMAPRAVRNTKQMLYKGFNMDPRDSMMFGSGLEQNLSGMKDSVEGPKAFAEKRRPNFIDG